MLKHAMKSMLFPSRAPKRLYFLDTILLANVNSKRRCPPYMITYTTSNSSSSLRGVVSAGDKYVSSLGTLSSPHGSAHNDHPRSLAGRISPTARLVQLQRQVG